MKKLSEIIIEIAMQGLRNKKYAHSEHVHALMFLAHVAWNRDTKSPYYLTGDELAGKLKSFPINKKTIARELISEDWEKILEKMLAYKKKHHTDDSRVITLCGYTPWGTLRVEWE
jgi:hypothetical protein